MISRPSASRECVFFMTRLTICNRLAAEGEILQLSRHQGPLKRQEATDVSGSRSLARAGSGRRRHQASVVSLAPGTRPVGDRPGEGRTALPETARTACPDRPRQHCQAHRRSEQRRSGLHVRRRSHPAPARRPADGALRYPLAAGTFTAVSRAQSPLCPPCPLPFPCPLPSPCWWPLPAAVSTMMLPTGTWPAGRTEITVPACWSPPGCQATRTLRPSWCSWCRAAPTGWPSRALSLTVTMPGDCWAPAGDVAWPCPVDAL